MAYSEMYGTNDRYMVAYELAGLERRIIAIIIDALLIGLVGGSLFSFGSGFGGLLGFAIGLGYQWYFLTRHKGQTPGKMLMGIRVIKADGTVLNDSDVTVRYVGYLLNTTLVFLGWVWAFADRDRQGLHDKLANTYVVKA